MTTLPEVSSTERFDVVTVNELFQSVSPAAAFGIDWSETVALNVGIFGGIAPDGTEKADTSAALTASQTNYVEMTTAGVVSVNTSAYTSGRVKLFRLVTNANGITSYTDDRSFAPGGLSVLGPTSSTDNAVTLFDGTTGKLLKNSVVTISSAGAIAGATSLTIAQGTITDPANALTITTTWNDASDTFVAASIDVTDTNSATDSVILRGRVGGTTLWAFNKSGRLTIGNGGVALAGAGPTIGYLQLAGTSSTTATFMLSHWANDGLSGRYEMAKSRGGTVGVHGAVTSGTDLLTIRASGSDGAGFFLAAQVMVEADGTISTGIVSGRWSFQTATSAGTMTEALRLNSAQQTIHAPGSAALPSLVLATGTPFSTMDTTTGWYRSATNEWAFSVATANLLTLAANTVTLADACNIAVNTSTGTKIGTATTQKIGFWNKAPAVQPSTSTTAATRTGGGGTTLTDTDTFNGYTVARVVGCLQSVGILT